MSPKPIRTKLRRLYVPDAIYFITGNTQWRRPIFADDDNVELLRETMRKVQEIHPFGMRAYAFMPDHFHLLIFVPGMTISKILHSMQRNFTLNYKKAHNITDKLKLWQRGFWDHIIRDERDYLNHFNYIHFNPVKHAYVTRPEDYPHTSYPHYLEQGMYEIGWGHIEPEDLNGLDFEEPPTAVP